MSHTYLLDLHQLIDKRIEEARESLDNSENDPGMIKFHEGRIEILSDLKMFLSENLDPKLPRAFRTGNRANEM